jgi:hypothetical protein
MNTALLTEVRDHILQHPRNFDMQHWGTISAPGRQMIRIDDGYVLKPEVTQAFLRHECGTTACIAGWALILASKEGPRDLDLAVSATAAQVLEVDYEDGLRLFFSDDWPEQFKVSYWAANDLRGRAYVAAKRIDHFIATEGRE